MNIEEMQKEENFEHEVLDRLKCLDPSDFDYNAVDGSYADAVLKARDVILTAYEKEKGENVKLRLQDIPLIEGELKAYKDRVNELKQELEKEKEKNKELEEQNKDMKSLFNIQVSIAKELDFNTNEKMVKFKDEYYVPDTMAINANIGEPKTIELRYISATKYLTKFDVEE